MKTIVGFSLTVLLAITKCYAWNGFGHMAVAYVAYQQLSPGVKQRANELLKRNPEFTNWSSWIPNGTSAADRDLMIFMLAATWPDQIKGQPHHLPPINPVTNHRYVADGSHGGNRPEGSPNPSANEGFTDNSMHKYWHFIDMPFTPDNSPLTNAPDINAQERIALFRSVLASNASDDLKSYDLAWLLHLLGDVHQPLHCTSRFTQDDPGGDDGGNLVLISVGTGTNTTSLHSIWDERLGQGSDKEILTNVIKVAKQLPSASSTSGSDANEQDWINESFQKAKSDAYVSPIGNGNGPFTLTSAYKSNALDVAQQRVALAGVRLANLLEANLK